MWISPMVIEMTLMRSSNKDLWHKTNNRYIDITTHWPLLSSFPVRNIDQKA
ncbi:hypothetical protein RDWZM_008686, partial [Blomia tropicalis]